MRIAPFQPWITLIPPEKGDTDAPEGVCVKFAPASKPMRMAAARAAARSLERLGIDPGELTGRELTEDEIMAVFAAGDEAARALIRLGALADPNPEWKGVLDLDGKPLELNADTLEWAMLDDAFFEAADRLYVRPAAAKDREKNGSAASPNGTGEAATPGKDIAKSRAGARRGGGAKPAPTKPTRPKRPKGNSSGAS